MTNNYQQSELEQESINWQQLIKCLEYIKNNEGNVTYETFINAQCHDGQELWQDFYLGSVIQTEDDGQLTLTDEGFKLLSQNKR